MEDKEIVAVIARALDGLGATEAEVAAALSYVNATGVQYDSCNCPVSRYISAVLHRHSVEGQVLVDSWRVLVSGRHNGLHVPLPGPVRTFVRAFDDGHYPALVCPLANLPAGTSNSEEHTEQGEPKEQ